VVLADNVSRNIITEEVKEEVSGDEKEFLTPSRDVYIP